MEKTELTNAQNQNRVRQRISQASIDPDKYEYIPAKEQNDHVKADQYQQVAIYARVSTDNPIYDKYGQAVLDRTLRLAAATWEGENNSFSGNILMGIARIVVAYGDTVRDDVFKDHVGRVSVKAIIRAAKERRPGALGYSEAMIIEYNKKSKFRLSLKTLYGGKAMSGEDDFGEE